MSSIHFTSATPPWLGANRRAVSINRISYRRQAEGVSLPTQRETAEKYVGEHGIEIIQTFEMIESAALATKRKKIRAAIDYALEHNAEHLLLHMWDRFTRNMTDPELMEELIRAGKISLHITSDRRVLHSNRRGPF